MEYSYDNNIIQNAIPIFNITLSINDKILNTEIIGWNLPNSSKINKFIGLFFDNKLFYQEDLFALDLASNLKNKKNEINSNNDLKTNNISADFNVKNNNISPPSKKRKFVI
jgi:hypothetical protein